MRHTQEVGLPWTSDRHVAEATTYTTQQTQKTGIHAPSEIRTRDPGNEGAANLNLRVYDHRDGVWNIERAINEVRAFLQSMSQKM